MRPEVADALRDGPFHHALRVAIRARGLSLERLRDRLGGAGYPVGLATLSSWQLGRRQPERPESREAITALEQVLELPTGALVGLLGAPRRRGPGPRSRKPPRPLTELVRLGGPVLELMRGLDWHADQVRVLSAWDYVEVTAGSHIASVETVLVVEALADVDRYVTVYHGTPGIDLETFRLASSPHGRVGRVRQDPRHPLIVAELPLGRRLAAGETAVVRLRTCDSSGSVDTEFGRFFPSPVHHLTVQVHFAADARPRRCWRFTRDRQGWPDHAQTELTVDDFGHAHVVRQAVPAGMAGIAWEPE